MIKSEILEQNISLDEDAQKDKFLTFAIGSSIYGVDIKCVTEIIGMQPIIDVPNLPVYMKGIIKLRGKIIPVMDMRLRFKKDFKDYNGRTCIVIVHVSDVAVGLIVDSVSEVVTILENNIVPPPLAQVSFRNNCVQSIGKVEGEVKLIINCNKLLNEDEMDTTINSTN